MKRNLLACAAVFTLSIPLGVTLNGCESDCHCLPTPPRPEAQGPLPGLGVQSYDSRGEAAHVPVEPEDGTIEVTGDNVVIIYRQAGVQHRVVYHVTSPR